VQALSHAEADLESLEHRLRQLEDQLADERDRAREAEAREADAREAADALAADKEAVAEKLAQVRLRAAARCEGRLAVWGRARAWCRPLLPARQAAQLQWRLAPPALPPLRCALARILPNCWFRRRPFCLWAVHPRPPCCLPSPASAPNPTALQAEKTLVEKEELFAQVHAQMQAQVEQVIKQRGR
jgi:hypothetical protein